MKKYLVGLVAVLLIVGCAGRGEPEEYRNGLLALKNKDYEQGIQFLAKVVDKYPGSIYAAQAIFHTGLAYQRGLMDLERAEEYYRQYLENFPDHSHRQEAEEGLAACFYWQDDFAQALPIYQRMLKESPAKEWIAYQIVMCYYNQKQYEKCRLTVESFIRQRPKGSFVPSMIYCVADSYQIEENWLAARDSYLRLIESFPLHKLRWSAKKDLARLADRLPAEEEATPTAETGAEAAATSKTPQVTVVP
jgi:TolA-binding protein